MKYLIAIAMLHYITCTSHAQEAGLFIPVSLGFELMSKDISLDNQEKLKNKVQQILSRNGISAEGWGKDFVVYPKIDLYESETIDGLQKMVVVKAEFSLYFKQNISDMIFSSVSHSIKGSGKSIDHALAKSISSIRLGDNQYKEFVEKGKTKMLRYFNENCSQFIAKSNTFLQVQQYGEAFVELVKIPTQAEGCYAKAQEQMLVIYQNFQKNECEHIVQKGKAAIASQQFGDALNYLINVDPDAPCFKEASTLIKTIKDKVNELELRNWNFRVQQYNDIIALQQMRIDAVVKIANAYTKKEPDNLYYNLIVR